MRENLVTVGVKHAGRVAASRAARDFIPGNTIIPTIIRAAVLAAVFHIISRHRKYVGVDSEIIDVDII